MLPFGQQRLSATVAKIRLWIFVFRSQTSSRHGGVRTTGDHRTTYPVPSRRFPFRNGPSRGFLEPRIVSERYICTFVEDVVEVAAKLLSDQRTRHRNFPDMISALLFHEYLRHQ